MEIIEYEIEKNIILYTTFSEWYDTESNTITIINQLDENPCSDKNVKEHYQYQHGDVNVSGETFYAGVFIVLLSLNRHIT